MNDDRDRRKFLRTVGTVVGGTTIAGCQETDDLSDAPVQESTTNQTETSTPTSVKAKIRNDIANKIVEVYDSTTGENALDLRTGKTYYLVVNPAAVDTLKNQIELAYKHFRTNLFGTQSTFLLDSTKSKSDYLSTGGNSTSLIRWEFHVPDSYVHQETGNIRIKANYKTKSTSSENVVYRYYNLRDESPDTSYIVNPRQPVTTLPVEFGYFGPKKSTTEIAKLRKQFASNFEYATKGYVDLNVTDLGRKEYPADGAKVAGKVHDYTSWWNSLSHDLSGTDLSPLDPADPDDLRLIKIAWYSAHKKQLKKDIEHLFDISLTPRTVIFDEMQTWAAGGSSFASVPIYNPYLFWEQKNGTKQWGKPKKFGPHARSTVMKIALHELGHLYGLRHPETTEIAQNGRKSTEVRKVEKFGNVMHTGNLQYYPTDRFYTDQDIDKLSPQTELSNVASELDIPFVSPIGDPLKKSSIKISGKKQSGSGININGTKTVAANNKTTWSATVNLDVGENKYEISQVSNGKTSHPYLLYVTRTTDALPSAPTLTLSKTYPPSNNVEVGDNITIELGAQAESGLKAIWWWVEKKSGDSYEQVPGLGHWHRLYGSVQATREYRTAFRAPGKYKLLARARSMDYPNSQEDGQSDVASVTFDVK